MQNCKNLANVSEFFVPTPTGTLHICQRGQRNVPRPRKCRLPLAKDKSEKGVVSVFAILLPTDGHVLTPFLSICTLRRNKRNLLLPFRIYEVRTRFPILPTEINCPSLNATQITPYYLQIVLT